MNATENYQENRTQWTYFGNEHQLGQLLAFFSSARTQPSFDEAMKIMRSWNYNGGGEPPIPIGKFYDIDMSRFNQMFPGYEPHPVNRDSKLKYVLENFI